MANDREHTPHDMSEPKTLSETTSPNTEPTDIGDRDGDEGHTRKRQRVRLSCLECRRRKLSCDRGFPCERCIKSGTPERCTYETRPGLAPPAKNGLSQGALAAFDSRLSFSNSSLDLSLYRKDSTRDHDRIRRLELEVVQLKNLLEKQQPAERRASHADVSPATHRPQSRDGVGETPIPQFVRQHQLAGADEDELRFFRGKEFKTRYFGPHNACMAFSELTGLTPFMKETAEEWLKPLHFKTKDRGKRKREREERFAQPDPELEALLPSKEETDALVSVYLDQFEQVHRIVHVPSFRKEYAKFWDPAVPRYAAFTALVLAMMSISSCLHGNTTGKYVGMISHSHHMAVNWVKACEQWHSRQSQKHRKLIHYQIVCMIYLAKRVNTIKKKRFWKDAGALVQDCVSVGLHRDPSHIHDNISVYNQEMRRRIWATIVEFDMQASCDHGLPSLLSSLHTDVEPPSNLDDEDFSEGTTQLPESKPADHYTFSSYQYISRQSLPLRLELSRVLTGSMDEFDYEQVIRYTNDITQEIDSLPSWDVGVDKESESKRKPLLAYTLLHIQLRQYIIPLHQPYLKLRKTNSKYQYSEIIYYNAARDMVLLHDKLTEQGVRTLNFLREDALTLSINLCSVTMLQSRGSTNMIMVNAQHTIKLLEKCLAMKEDRIIRCGNDEPWGYSIMCAAFGLLEAHLGEMTPEKAKASSAERFINLHYRLLAWQEPPGSSGGAAAGTDANTGAGQGAGAGAGPGPGLPPQWNKATLESTTDQQKSATPMFPTSQASSQGLASIDASLPVPWWLPNATPAMPQMQPINPDFSLELLGVNLNELWGDYSYEEFS